MYIGHLFLVVLREDVTGEDPELSARGVNFPWNMPTLNQTTPIFLKGGSFETKEPPPDLPLDDHCTQALQMNSSFCATFVMPPSPVIATCV